MSESDEVLKEFLVESGELLDVAERDLMALEKGGANAGKLASVFRGFHTITGTADFFGFVRLQGLTHVAENVLGKMRDGKLMPTAANISALLAVADRVRTMLASIESSGKDGGEEPRDLIDTLQGFLAAAAAPSAVAPSAVAPSAAVAALPASAPALAAAPPTATPAPAYAAASAPSAPVAPGAAQPSTEGETELQTTAASASSIRVDVGLLEKLMNLVGELVLARNQLLQFTSTHEDAPLLAASQHLITAELQEEVMKARMQPIDNIWNNLPRVVRDLAMASGKKVHVEMDGRETELDRTIIEAIKDPLTHIVRNAVDHGLELPAKRRSAGKPEEGRLFLRAFHEGGQVNIEISDDGAGIAIERVKQKAVERGLVTADQLERLSVREILGFIFLPGFSTAEKVTNVSGRGVGMDVVKTNIERIGGTVDVQTEVGKGTTVKIKIPLTLAIIPALIVTTGGDRYAIPQVSLLELVRLEHEQASQGVENIQGVPVYRLRGRLLPLVHLASELKVEAGGEADATNIVVLQADDRQFGLVVDEVNDTEEIVVKPLGKQLKGLSVFAGATILGDGRVALILDVLGLAQRAKVVGEVHKAALRDERTNDTGPQERDRRTLLVVGGPGGGRFAVPLSVVSRLEELRVDSIERAGGLEVVQYRGEILPLVRLLSVLEERRKHPRAAVARPDEPGGTLSVIVLSDEGRDVGLVVEEILDIVEEGFVLRDVAARRGVLGSAVIAGRITELLDIKAVLKATSVALGKKERKSA